MFGISSNGTRRNLFFTSIISCLFLLFVGLPAEAYLQRVNCETGEPIYDQIKKPVTSHTQKRHIGLRKMNRRHNNHRILHRRHCHKLKCYVQMDDNAFGGGGSYGGEFFGESTASGYISTPWFGGAGGFGGGGRLDFPHWGKFHPEKPPPWIIPPVSLIPTEPKTTTTSVPEVSTWLMMLTGFAGLGILGHNRKQKRMG